MTNFVGKASSFFSTQWICHIQTSGMLQCRHMIDYYSFSRLKEWIHMQGWQFLSNCFALKPEENWFSMNVISVLGTLEPAISGLHRQKMTTDIHICCNMWDAAETWRFLFHLFYWFFTAFIRTYDWYGSNQ